MGRESYRYREKIPWKILKRTAYILLAVLVLWGIVGFLATIPVVGKHPYWRALRAQPKDFGLEAEDVSFQSLDGIHLTAWYIAARPAAHGTVIIAHGINGNRSDMLPRAAFLVRDGFNTLLIDLRGHGESGGDYAGPGYMESFDVLAGVNYLRKRGAQAPIVTMGHSYGAVAALFAGAQSPDVAGVISDGAFVSYDDNGEARHLAPLERSGKIDLGTNRFAIGRIPGDRICPVADFLSSHRGVV
jgi:pimeloyl-ACP methyl ester carboxylesterase